MPQNKRMKKIFQAKEPKKKAAIVFLISNKICFNSKLTRKDWKAYYILTKGTIHPENIAILFIYASNTGALKFIKEILLQLKPHIDHTHCEQQDASIPHFYQ